MTVPSEHGGASTRLGTSPVPPVRGNTPVSTQPIDATTTSAWQDLSEHESTLTPDLRGWFAAAPARPERLAFDAAALRVDLSKNLVTDETLALLVRLADEVGLAEHLQAMLR